MASLLLLFLSAFSALRCGLSEIPPLCRDQSATFLYALQSQCPASISPNPHHEVDGDFLDKILSSKQQNTFTAVLFYASWCPFSQRLLPMYDVLSSIFPQIDHLAIEQSSAVPGVFSRYGIHSLPSILLVSQSQMIKYHGPKNLQSLVEFHGRVTGLKPISSVTNEHETNSIPSKNRIFSSRKKLSLKDMLKNEPYLMFSVLFLCLKLLCSILPRTFSCLKAFWVSRLPRTHHVLDVRRFWMRLRHCKTRNFHGGAKSARVWASSLASVSLDQTTSDSSFPLAAAAAFSFHLPELPQSITCLICDEIFFIARRLYRYIRY